MWEVCEGGRTDRYPSLCDAYWDLQGRLFQWENWQENKNELSRLLPENCDWWRYSCMWVRILSNLNNSLSRSWKISSTSSGWRMEKDCTKMQDIIDALFPTIQRYLARHEHEPELNVGEDISKPPNSHLQHPTRKTLLAHGHWTLLNVWSRATCRWRHVWRVSERD